MEGDGNDLSRTDFFAHAIAVLALVATVGFVSAPTARFVGDERYYTDAALAMMVSGDFGTPRYLDGSLRFNKPILAYWSVTLGISLRGASVAAARYGSVLAMTLAVAATGLLTFVVFARRRAAWLGMCALALNANHATLAPRCTPDAWLTAFLALSWAGAAAVLVPHKAPRWAPWALACGMGLAIATKGLLGLSPLLILAFARVTGMRLTVRSKDWCGPVLVGGLLATVWFAWVAYEHGLGAISGFSSDQTNDRSARSALVILVHLRDYTLVTLTHFSPALAPIALWALRSRSSFANALRVHRRSMLSLLAAYGLLLLICSLGSELRGRYLHPMYPLLSAALGGLWSASAARPSRGVVGWIVVLAGFGVGWSWLDTSVAWVAWATSLVVAWFSWREWRSGAVGLGSRSRTLVYVALVLVMQGVRHHTLEPRLRPDLSSVFRQIGERPDFVGASIATTGIEHSDLGRVRMTLGRLDIGDVSEFPQAPVRVAPASAAELERWRRGERPEPGSAVEIFSVDPITRPSPSLPWLDRPMDAMVYRVWRVEESHRGR